jgi:hypothetical protein
MALSINSYFFWHVIYKEVLKMKQMTMMCTLKNMHLLNGMKRYLGIEHRDSDNELLEYLRKLAARKIINTFN